MKPNSFIASFILVCIVFSACQKEANNTEPEQLSASKQTNVKKGESIVFQVVSAGASESFAWSVSPGSNHQLKDSAHTAAALFEAKGRYTVTARSQQRTAVATVMVNDSVYTPPVIGNTPFTAGEVIEITVSKIDSGSARGLQFYARTVNSYPCVASSINHQTTISGNNININYSGVHIPSSCSPGPIRAGRIHFLNPISTGISSLNITVNGTTYNGSINRTGDSYGITWPNKSVVRISPLSL